MKIELGMKVRDKVTGFEGIATGLCQYLYGCQQIGITPSAKDGEIKNTQWFDEGRIEYLDIGITPSSVRAAENGAGESPAISHGHR